MSKRTEFASVSLDVGLGTEPQRAAEIEEKVFRILVVGDFSGKTAGSSAGPVLIDRDNIDEVLGGMGVKLALGGGIVLPIRRMDDFHPDQIYERVEGFRKLGGQTVAAATPTGGSLLDSIVDAMEPEPEPAEPPASEDELKAFARRVVAPHLVPREDALAVERKKQADVAAGKLMRAILHHERFQALEAAWRGLQFLVDRLETGEFLKVYCLDMAKAGLSRLPEVLRGDTWDLVAGNFTFDQSAEDIETLRSAGEAVGEAGARFFAEASPNVGEASKAWGDFRQSREARSICLALPRFLLRLPYGRDTYSIESFAFEETPGVPVHEEYLWGNPAFALALLLGKGGEIDGLPLHVYEDKSGSQVKSCAEVEMTEDDVEWILDQGYIPLVWMRNEASVRVPRVRPVALG